MCKQLCVFVGIGKKKRKSRGDFKQRYRKTFAALIEEEVQIKSFYDWWYGVSFIFYEGIICNDLVLNNVYSYKISLKI